jgi:serine/threonine-protein kinase RsbW
MADGAWKWLIDEQIPSDPDVGRSFVERLLRQLESDNWQSEDIFGINLAVEEAMVNAIKHGNKCSPDKKVHVLFQLNDQVVRVQITDEGEGFCPEEVPDPTCEDRLEIPGGRGLMLMRHCMSTVIYNDRGNRVLLEKHRGEPSGLSES